MPWRRLEKALINVAIRYGYECYQDHDNGDTICDVSDEDDVVTEINLTDLAKDLAEEIKP